jgi:polyphosphate glucokinase
MATSGTASKGSVSAARAADLVLPLPPFDRISVSFPGGARDGIVLTAPDLGHADWQPFDLAGALTARLGKPSAS